MIDQNKWQDWYLVYTKVNDEFKAKEHLENQSFEVYLPQAPFELLRSGKRVKLVQPLFPRYIFVQVPEDGAFHLIRSTRGCSNFVRFGENYPLQVPPSLIQSLQHMPKLDALEDESLFKKGEQVEILQGPYKQLNAVFLEPDGEKRSLLLVEIMHQQAKLLIDNKSLKKL